MAIVLLLTVFLKMGLVQHSSTSLVQCNNRKLAKTGLAIAVLGKESRCSNYSINMKSVLFQQDLQHLCRYHSQMIHLILCQDTEQYIRQHSNPGETLTKYTIKKEHLSNLRSTTVQLSHLFF